MKLKLTKPDIKKLTKRLKKDGVVVWRWTSLGEQEQVTLKNQLSDSFPDVLILERDEMHRFSAVAIRVKEPKNDKAKKEKAKTSQVADDSVSGRIRLR